MKNAIGRKEARTLRLAVAHILEEPKRYDQNFELFTRRTPGSPHPGVGAESYKLPNHTVPACGTIGCLAGWVAVLDKNFDVVNNDPIYFATHKLRLTETERKALFGSQFHWPEPFQSQYHKAKTLRKRAKVLQARVEHFIKTGL